MIVAAKLLIVDRLAGRRVLEARPPLRQRDPADGVQHAVAASQDDQAACTTATSRTTCGRRSAPSGLAHVGGTLVEFGTPLVLLFSHNDTLTVVAVVVMIGFHLFIISTFPLAVPLEWNALFMYIAAFLFLGYPTHDGFGLGDMDAGAAGAHAVGALLFFPVLGNLRPDLVSFLPSMRQYAGNWASAMWAFAPGRRGRSSTSTSSSPR